MKRDIVGAAKFASRGFIVRRRTRRLLHHARGESIDVRGQTLFEGAVGEVRDGVGETRAERRGVPGFVVRGGGVA